MGVGADGRARRGARPRRLGSRSIGSLRKVWGTPGSMRTPATWRSACRRRTADCSCGSRTTATGSIRRRRHCPGISGWPPSPNGPSRRRLVPRAEPAGGWRGPRVLDAARLAGRRRERGDLDHVRVRHRSATRALVDDPALDAADAPRPLSDRADEIVQVRRQEPPEGRGSVFDPDGKRRNSAGPAILRERRAEPGLRNEVVSDRRRRWHGAPGETQPTPQLPPVPPRPDAYAGTPDRNQLPQPGHRRYSLLPGSLVPYPGQGGPNPQVRRFAGMASRVAAKERPITSEAANPGPVRRVTRSPPESPRASRRRPPTAPGRRERTNRASRTSADTRRGTGISTSGRTPLTGDGSMSARAP